MTRPRLGLAALAAAIVALAAPPARAQPSGPEPAPPAHRFLDGLNVGLTAAAAGALLADGIYTQRGLTRYPETSREADPLARPFVLHGWPGQIAGGALVLAADLGLRYWLHRKNHHRIERWLPAILISYGTAGAIHNARELRLADQAAR